MSNITNAIATPLENLVEQAKTGDKNVLEEIIRRIQDKIYGLAIRMLYIPADAEDAKILGLTPAAYRQRLYRGKKLLMDFLVRRCGLVDPKNPCHCKTLAALHVKKRHIDPKHLLFAAHPRLSRQDGHAENLLKELNQMARAAMLIRNHPDYAAPGVFVESMKGLIDSGRFQLLGR